MPKMIDLVGMTFNRLTVIQRDKGTRRGVVWKCLCTCGSNISVRAYDLKIGKTKSCGCYYRETRHIEYGEATFHSTLRDYKGGAKQRGLSFELTEDHFRTLTQKECFYCGDIPRNLAKSKSNNGDFTYNGIDRLDSNKGYIITNCVPCCRICNRAKSNLTIEEWGSYIKRLGNKYAINNNRQ